MGVGVSGAPEKQAVHRRQRPFWHSSIDWLSRAEGVDRTIGSSRDVASKRHYKQHKSERKRNDKLRLSPIHDWQRV